MAYCTPADVTLGSMDLPRGVSVQTVIDTQAEFIDAVLGRIYRLPIVLDAGNPAHKPYKFLLKKLNAYMATGTILLNAGGAQQVTDVNAYALWYLNHAEIMLKKIEDREVDFPGQEPANPGTDDADAPMVVAKDSFSRVDAFYEVDQQIPPWQGDRVAVSPWE